MAARTSSRPLLEGLTTGFAARWDVWAGSGEDGLIQTAGTLLFSLFPFSPFSGTGTLLHPSLERPTFIHAPD